MLASFTVTLRQTSKEEWTAPAATGGFVRALFYELLRSESPALADEIHSSPSDMPFTVSPMIRQRITEGESPVYRIRFTTLTEQVFDAACRALYTIHTKEAPVHISKAEFAVSELEFKRNKRMCRLMRYSDVASGIGRDTFRFKLITPTAFKSGKVNVSLPIPRLMFGGYLRKWNTFAPDNLRMDESLLKAIDESVLISRHDIQSRVLDMQAMKMIGFIGECVLEVSGKVDSNSLNALNTLYSFAFFCGTGAKTTIGMGQTMVDG